MDCLVSTSTALQVIKIALCQYGLEVSSREVWSVLTDVRKI